jgi:methylaspartate ammonia-lyase
MSGKSTNPFELFQLPPNLFATPQKFMPNAKVFEQLNEIARTLAEAQIAYGQALMRANTAMLSAIMSQAAPAAEEKSSKPTA